MVENDAFGQIIVKIGDFGSAYFSILDKKLSEGTQTTYNSIIKDDPKLLNLKQNFVTMSYIGP